MFQLFGVAVVILAICVFIVWMKPAKALLIAASLTGILALVRYGKHINPTLTIGALLLVFGVIGLAFILQTFGETLSEDGERMGKPVGPYYYHRGRGGVLVGYKWLRVKNGRICSPSGAEWVMGRLTANELPSDENGWGIFCYREINDKRLEEYADRRMGIKCEVNIWGNDDGRGFIEYENGFRAYNAEITRILEVGEGVERYFKYTYRRG